MHLMAGQLNYVGLPFISAPVNILQLSKWSTWLAAHQQGVDVALNLHSYSWTARTNSDDFQCIPETM